MSVCAKRTRASSVGHQETGLARRDRPGFDGLTHPDAVDVRSIDRSYTQGGHWTDRNPTADRALCPMAQQSPNNAAPHWASSDSTAFCGGQGQV